MLKRYERGWRRCAAWNGLRIRRHHRIRIDKRSAVRNASGAQTLATRLPGWAKRSQGLRKSKEEGACQLGNVPDQRSVIRAGTGNAWQERPRCRHASGQARRIRRVTRAAISRVGRAVLWTPGAGPEQAMAEARAKLQRRSPARMEPSERQTSQSLAGPMRHA